MSPSAYQAGAPLNPFKLTQNSLGLPLQLLFSSCCCCCNLASHLEACGWISMPFVHLPSLIPALPLHHHGAGGVVLFSPLYARPLRNNRKESNATSTHGDGYKTLVKAHRLNRIGAPLRRLGGGAHF